MTTTIDSSSSSSLAPSSPRKMTRIMSLQPSSMMDLHSSDHQIIGNDDTSTYLKRIQELEALLKQSALDVVESERSLIQTLKAEDVADDLNELENKIHNNVGTWEEENNINIGGAGAGAGGGAGDRKSWLLNKVNNFRSSRNITSKWSPEKALRMALKSLNNSIDFFENERDLNLSKQQIMKVATQESISNLTQLRSQHQELTTDRDKWRQQCIDHEQDMIMVQELKDQLESAQGEKEDLVTKTEERADEILFLRKQRLLDHQQHKEDLQEQMIQIEQYHSFDCDSHLGGGDDDEEPQLLNVNSSISKNNDSAITSDDELETTMLTMQNSMEELESENDRLQQTIHEQAEKIQSLTKKSRLAKFDERLEDKANDFKVDDLQVRLEDLTKDFENLQHMNHTQVETITTLKSERSADRSTLFTLQQEREEIDTKCNSLEAAIALISEERATFRQSLREVEEHKDLLLAKIKSQTDSFQVMQHDSEETKLQQMQEGMRTQCSIHQMAQKVDEFEDASERWTAKCTTQQARISILEDELERVTAEAISQDSKISLLERGGKIAEEHKELKLDATLLSLRSKVEEIEELLQESDTKCQSQADTIAMLNTLRQQASNRDCEVQANQKDLETTMVELAADLDELQEERDQLQQQIQQRQQDEDTALQELRLKVEYLEKSKVDLHMSSAEKDKAHQHNLVKLKGKIVALQTEQHQLKTSLATETKKHLELQLSTLPELKEAESDAMNQAGMLKTQVAGLKVELELTKQQQQQQQKDDVSAMQSRIQELETERDTYAIKVATQEEAFAQLTHGLNFTGFN